MTPPGAVGRVLYLVVCAAPPARHIGELVAAAQQDGWTVCLITTPQAVTWIDVDQLAARTGYPIRTDYRQPDDPDPLPPAAAIAVVPATFNTINKWAAGISDTFALGLLNESIGLRLLVVVAPYAKPTLAAHPTFQRSLTFLHECGLTILDTDAIRPDDAATDAGQAFRWHLVGPRCTPTLTAGEAPQHRLRSARGRRSCQWSQMSRRWPTSITTTRRTSSCIR